MMESPTSTLRLRLILGKFRVVEVHRGAAKIALGGSASMTIGIPDTADIRPNDLLTLYTEVPTKGIPDAPLIGPSIQ